MSPGTGPSDHWADDLRRLSDLAVLAAVVETGSWSRSASILGREPSDLRSAVSRLEADTGGVLLHEAESGLRATLLGAACVAHASWLRDRVQDLPAILSGVAADRLVVAATPAAAEEADRLVAAFRQRHPEVRVDVVAAGPGDDTSSREADVLVLARGEDPGANAAPRASRDGITVAVLHLGLVSRAFVAEACDAELTRPAYRRTRVQAPASGGGTVRRVAVRDTEVR